MKIKIFKILFFNLIFIITLFIISEILVRSYLTIRHFKKPYAHYWGNTWHLVQDKNNTFLRFHEILGTIPKENTSIKNIKIPRWKNNSDVTINNISMRDNKNNILSKKKILLIGDSIAFGEQVSDSETWSSCLEKKINIRIDNAGVGSYGAFQSVLRGKIETNNRKYDGIIWSIFILDFHRDLDTSNRTRPYLYKEDSLIKINKPYFRETILNEKKTIYQNFENFLLQKSFILWKINSKFSNLISRKEITESAKVFHEKISIEESVNYSFSEFKKLPAKDKIIIIHYLDPFNEKGPEMVEAKKLKPLIIKNANKYNIKIIDIFDEISKVNKKDINRIWYDHYTAEGNNYVCDIIDKKTRNIKFIN